MSNKLFTFAQRLIDLCWPQRCFVCDEITPTRAVCGPCAAHLPWLDPATLCPRCALPSPQGAVCGRCLRRPPPLDASWAVFAYATPIRERVLALKHGQGFAQIDWMADLMLRRLAEIDPPPDLIVPMPLHADRLKDRGFNQSAELVRRLHRANGPNVALEVLVRDIDTPRLEGLRQRERLRAVRGAFRCRTPVTGLHVLIVDDVMTSGASLYEAARTLQSSGAARVSALLLARTLRQPAL